jgi:hypothetical protein
MPLQISLLWASNRTINRVPYVLVGVLLFATKFAIDWTIATQWFDRPWSPFNYLIWPTDRVTRVFELGDPEREFSLALLLVSVPFIWTGVVLSLHRLRSARAPLLLVLLFFVPLVNLFLFLILALLPPRRKDWADDSLMDVLPADEPSYPRPGGAPDRIRPVLPGAPPVQRVHGQDVRSSYWGSALISLAITVPFALLAVVLGAQVFQSYGFGLFVGAPFAVGMVSVLIFGFSEPKPFGLCVAVAMTTGAVVGLGVLLFALEGAICLIMAAPIAFFLVFLGAVVGHAIQSRSWLRQEAPAVTMAILIALPSLMAAEWASETDPMVRQLDTEVVVDASPTTVWQNVIAFSPLPEPDDWFSRTGIAYPQRAEIDGSGVGAVRRCVFSTGTFVEPIEVWNPPNLLRFQVTEQPEPMREWSPYHIHPAHLNRYLCSHRGQFLIEALPDGRTRLVGTTWYSNRMWPGPYWSLWSDYIIHRIHSRVLNHIKTLAEEPANGE